jgi:hypothetical protein
MEEAMEQKRVGVYEAGFDRIELFIREGTGAEFYMRPESDLLPAVGALPRIKIGMDYDSWPEVLECVLHEVEEFIMYRKGLRFEPSGHLSNDSTRFLFILSHVDFADVMAKTADFLSSAQGDLRTAWRTGRPRRRKLPSWS